MPKQKNNIVMKSTRGMLGKQVVFKKRAGKSYVAAPPEVNENRVPTANQTLALERFKDSSEYAVEAIKDPAVKAAYLAVAKPGQTPYNVAFRDAYNVPKVSGMITQGYLGQPGNIIVVQAKDDFKVMAVKFSIYNSADELIEEGDAIKSKGKNWTYTVTQANADVAGTKIKATATDLPGNEGSLEITV